MCVAYVMTARGGEISSWRWLDVITHFGGTREVRRENLCWNLIFFIVKKFFPCQHWKISSTHSCCIKFMKISSHIVLKILKLLIIVSSQSLNMTTMIRAVFGGVRYFLGGKPTLINNMFFKHIYVYVFDVVAMWLLQATHTKLE